MSATIMVNHGVYLFVITPEVRSYTHEIETGPRVGWDVNIIPPITMERWDRISGQERFAVYTGSREIDEVITRAQNFLRDRLQDVWHILIVCSSAEVEQLKAALSPS